MLEACNGIRINKFISMSGYCSRRAADELVAQKRISVNGEVAVTGTKVMPQDVVIIDEEAGKLL